MSLQQIIRKFAKKVDTLNWQSISYQKKAFDTVEQELTEYITQEKLALLDEVMGKGENMGNGMDVVRVEDIQAIRDSVSGGKKWAK